MPQQEPFRVQTPAGIIEFPADMDREEIKRRLRERFPPPPTPTREGAQRAIAARPPTPARAAPGYDVRKSNEWARRNAPAIGATLAVSAGPAGWIPGLIAAGAGGTTGALLRGDEPTQAVKEGAKQAALEAGGRTVVYGLSPVARWLMKGNVPPNIAAKFEDVDIPQAMLDYGAIPGSARSTQAIAAQSEAANQARNVAARGVPILHAAKVAEGIRPIYEKAASGRVTNVADAAADYMRKSADEIGIFGLSGQEAIDRKDVLQDLAAGARNAASDSVAMQSLPAFAKAETGAISSHLRETPGMGEALDLSQRLMAVDKVMQAKRYSNALNAAKLSGLPTAIATSPTGTALTAHLANRGRHLAQPGLLRLLNSLLLNRRNREAMAEELPEP